MDTLLKQLYPFAQDVRVKRDEAGRSELGRILSIAATDLEKVGWAIKAAQEEERPKDFHG